MAIDINKAECMVTKTHIGYDQHINICSGAITDVSWTIVDWIGLSFLIAMALTIAIAVYYFIKLIREDF